MTIEIRNITQEALLKIQNDTINELGYKPTIDQIIDALILTITKCGHGDDLKFIMENIKYYEKYKYKGKKNDWNKDTK